MFTKLQPFFFSDFVDLTDPFDRMVVPRQASQHECSPQLSVSEPSTSIENDEKELRLSLDLPGVKASDLKIDVDKNILQISGYRQHSSSSQGQAIRKRRRISYSVQLDDGIDVAKIKANLSDGVLVVSAPKQSKPDPVLIPISSVPHDDFVETKVLQDKVKATVTSHAKTDSLKGDHKDESEVQ